MLDKQEYKLQLIIALGIIKLAAIEQNEYWNQKENFLEGDLKYSLTRLGNIAYESARKIDARGNVTTIEKKVFKVKDRILQRIIKKREYLEGIPEHLVKSYIEFKAAFIYIDKNLFQEVKDQQLETKFNIIRTFAKKYINFFESEVKGNEKIYR